MYYKITAPQQFNVDIHLPASKSIRNRVLLVQALSGKEVRKHATDDCDDIRVLINALQKLPSTIDIGAAGTAMRFLTAYLCTRPAGEQHTITGTSRMLQRPIGTLVDALRKLGADIEYLSQEGFPPLRIKSKPLTGNELTLTGSVSSQYISALLMIAPTLPQGLKLHLIGDILSRPYIDLTLKIMKSFGGIAEWSDECTLSVEPKSYISSTRYVVESDWTAASYWYEVMSLAPLNFNRLFLSGLTLKPQNERLQGDSRLTEIFKYLDVHTVRVRNGLLIDKREEFLLPLFINEDMSDIPDLAQTLAVTCCMRRIPFRLSGLQSLRIKETDRIEALITELRKLGFVLYARPDNSLVWDGERCAPDKRPVIRTYHDHRMAMSFAPACLLLPSIIIEDPQVVTKSYPTFWKEMETAGFQIKSLTR
ncbi:MAG: 3-phosphoshikimate 1-carboxyvinyltransferase [Prevotellaceae bacterium]|jgi:3-phosphoshikimate 1-carboxyvinyltransferase|nr:3-phosphoshikimate 1-carboxyvinyltransferase [Prevotellaceae bacterium]